MFNVIIFILLIEALQLLLCGFKFFCGGHETIQNTIVNTIRPPPRILLLFEVVRER